MFGTSEIDLGEAAGHETPGIKINVELQDNFKKLLGMDEPEPLIKKEGRLSIQTS